MSQLPTTLEPSITKNVLLKAYESANENVDNNHHGSRYGGYLKILKTFFFAKFYIKSIVWLVGYCINLHFLLNRNKYI